MGLRRGERVVNVWRQGRRPRSALDDARRGELLGLGTAASEGRDEASLARRERSPREARHVEAPGDRGPSGETEALELAALDLIRDGVPSEEGAAASLAPATRGVLCLVERPSMD
jgi:hypothetical protein